MLKRSLLIPFLILSIACNQKTALNHQTLKPLTLAPFEKLDTIAVNDWWNRGPNPIIDVDVPREEVIAFGMYTVSNKTLKLSAQLFPLYPKESKEEKKQGLY